MHQRGGNVFFASRLEMLRPVPGFDARVDDQAVFDYLYFHMIPSPRAVYRDVSKLLPAQVRVWRKGEASARFYWTMPYRDDNPAGFEALRREFRELLPQVVGNGGARVGERGWMFPERRNGQVSRLAGTFRQSAMRRFGPTPWASRPRVSTRWSTLASRRGTSRRTARVLRHPADVVDSVPRVAAYCDEPFGNASVVPAYCAPVRRRTASTACSPAMAGTRSSAATTVMPTSGCSALRANAGTFLRCSTPAVCLPRRDPSRAQARSYIDQAKVPLPDRFETYNFLHRTALAQVFDPDFLARVDGGPSRLCAKSTPAPLCPRSTA